MSEQPSFERSGFILYTSKRTNEETKAMKDAWKTHNDSNNVIFKIDDKYKQDSQPSTGWASFTN